MTKNPDGTTSWRFGMGASTPHTAVLAFAPAQGEIRPRDQVTFVNETAAPHTATFASGAQVPVDPTSPEAVAADGAVAAHRDPDRGAVQLGDAAAERPTGNGAGAGPQLHVRPPDRRRVRLRLHPPRPERDGRHDQGGVGRP